MFDSVKPDEIAKQIERSSMEKKQQQANNKELDFSTNINSGVG